MTNYGRNDGFIKLAMFRAAHAYAFDISQTRLPFLNRTACGRLQNATTDNTLLYALVSAMKCFTQRVVSRIHAGMSPVPETVRLVVQMSEPGFAELLDGVQPGDRCPAMISEWIWTEFQRELPRFDLYIEQIDPERTKILRTWTHNVLLNPWPNTRIERPKHVAHFGDPAQLFAPEAITA
jgi:hypothetical protein